MDLNDIAYVTNGAVFEIGIKTVENIDRVYEAQLLNSMKATGLQIGLLVDSKHQKADIKRMALNLPERHDG